MGALEMKRLGDHADRQNSRFAGDARDYRGAAGAGTAAHSGGDERHVGPVHRLEDFVERLLRGGASDIWPRAGAEPPGDADPELDLARRRGLRQRLSVSRYGSCRGVACRQEPRVFVNLAGDGTLRHKLAARVKALNVAGHYRYHGVYTHPEECRAFMNSLDVFVMPSFTEGTPNSVVEAMACSKPIIASTVGGIPDMIGEDAGMLVAPGEVNELAAAMLSLARDGELRKRMGIAARNRYRELFSPKVVMPLMLDVYRRVVSNGNSGEIGGNEKLHPWARR